MCINFILIYFEIALEAVVSRSFSNYLVQYKRPKAPRGSLFSILSSTKVLSTEYTYIQVGRPFGPHLGQLCHLISLHHLATEATTITVNVGRHLD